MSIKYITSGTLALKPVQSNPAIKVISMPRKNHEPQRVSICQQMFGYLHDQSASSTVQMVLKGIAVPNLFGNASEKRFARIACAVSVAMLFLLSFATF